MTSMKLHRLTDDTVMLCASLLGLCSVVHACWLVHDRLTPILRKEMVRVTAWCAILCMWPYVWNSLVGKCATCTHIGLVWPVLIMVADVCVRHYACNSKAGIHIEPHSLTGVTFAMAGMVGAVTDPQRIRLFIVPIVILLCFIVPSPSGLPDDSLKVVIETIQKAFITCAAAILMSGIVYRQPAIRID